MNGKERLLQCVINAEKILKELGVNPDKVGEELLSKNIKIKYENLPALTPAYYDPKNKVIGLSPRGLQNEKCGEIIAHETLHAAVGLPDHHWLGQIQCKMYEMFTGKKCDFWRPTPPGECCFLEDINCKRLDSECYTDAKRKSFTK